MRIVTGCSFKSSESLRDSDKYLIYTCRYFPRIVYVTPWPDLALAYNTYALSIWKMLSLPGTYPTRLTSFEASDSLLEEFADELALLDPFPSGNRDVNFEADLREIKLLLNRDPSTYFSPKITIDPNPERFINKPALVCLPPPGDDDDDKGCDFPFCDNKMIFSNPLFGFNDDLLLILEDVKSEDSNVSNSDEPVLLNTPLFDEDECFDPGGDIDEIDVFLAIDVSSDIMDAYNDSEGDVLEILLINNTTHNLFPEEFFDHEPQCFKD
ncbi:hypothetical protein Tco_1010287 [Tanacetum coccineum]